MDIMNTSGSRIGRINGNDILNTSGSKIGRVYGNDILDTSGSKIGRVNGNDILDTSGSRIGRINGDDILNTSGSRIGWVSGSGSDSYKGAAGMVLLGMLDESKPSGIFGEKREGVLGCLFGIFGFIALIGTTLGGRIGLAVGVVLSVLMIIFMENISLAYFIIVIPIVFFGSGIAGVIIGLLVRFIRWIIGRIRKK